MELGIKGSTSLLISTVSKCFETLSIVHYIQQNMFFTFISVKVPKRRKCPLKSSRSP